ncbi:hypothetical protein AAH450_17065 [Erwinia sp. P7711]|uniref:hypothetical protein n=1 Tax=Erwinia sp. P7711 TaxID=3141451 RepID=UPI00319CAB8C
MNKNKIEKIRMNKSKKPQHLNIYDIGVWLTQNLAKISLFSVLMGFLNLWFYLYRIDHLPLLPSMLTTPSTLLSISFALIIIIFGFFITLLLPTLSYSFSTLFLAKKETDTAVIRHSFFISLFLAITGVFDSETALGLFIYIISGYIIFFAIQFFYCEWRETMKIYSRCIIINFAFMIVLFFIYNRAGLSGIDRFYRFVVIFLYLISCYILMAATYDFLKSKRPFFSKKNILPYLLAFIIIMYLTMSIAPGFITRANDYAMTLAGLKSEQKSIFKVNPADYPDNWLKERWLIKYTNAGSVWVEGYAIFQNSNVKVICPTTDYQQIKKRMIEETTIFSKTSTLRHPSGNTFNCIDIENKPNTTLSFLGEKK